MAIGSPCQFASQARPYSGPSHPSWRRSDQRYRSQRRSRGSGLCQKLPQGQRRGSAVTVARKQRASGDLQDLAFFEATQETLALLKVLALGNTHVEQGKTRPVAEVVAQLRKKGKPA